MLWSTASFNNALKVSTASSKLICLFSDIIGLCQFSTEKPNFWSNLIVINEPGFKEKIFSSEFDRFSHKKWWTLCFFESFLNRKVYL